MPGNFESAVAGFLQGYALTSGIKSQRRQDRMASQRAATADQEATIRMDEAGYDRITMPTIEAPPGQNFAQKIGRFLSGGPDEPSTIAMKTHRSTREIEMEGARQARSAEISGRQGFEREMAGLKAADARKLQGDREAGADRRNRDDNATSITVAGLNRGAQRERNDLEARQQFFDEAVAAAGGDAVQAMANAEQFQMPLARKLGATRTDYHAAASRFRDRFTAKSQSGGGGAKPYAGKAAASAAPANTINQAEYQALKAQGFTDEQIKAQGYTVR